MAKTVMSLCLILAMTLMIQTLTPFVAGEEIFDPETGYVYVPASAPHNHEAYAPDLYIDDEPPVSPGAPTASPELVELVKGCVKNMDRQCGDEIYSQLIEETHVTRPCCEELLRMGMKCHVTLANLVLATDELKDKKAEGILKSKEIWNTCVSDVGAPVS